MESKICTKSNIEKTIKSFYNKYRDCIICSSKRSLKRYYQNKDKISKQRKIHFEKKRCITCKV